MIQIALLTIFLHPVKIEPANISLEEIHTIAKQFSFRFPNFYLYEKERIKSGWVLMVANFMLKLFHSNQPVWRMLILLRKVEKVTGITLIRRGIFELKSRLSVNERKRPTGFSLIKKRI